MRWALRSRAMRKISETHRLAQWFVSAIIRRPWTRADWHGVHVVHAKKLLSLDYKLEEIQACALAMVKNPDRFEGWNPGWKLQYLSTLLKGEPPYIEQWITPPPPPPIYESRAYDTWVQTDGLRAIRLNLWDGVYPVVDEPHRLSAEALRIILGNELVQKSLTRKAELCSDVRARNVDASE